MFLKVLHWILNAALLAAGVACFWLLSKVDGMGPKVGLILTGVAFLAAFGVFTVHTLRKG